MTLQAMTPSGSNLLSGIRLQQSVRVKTYQFTLKTTECASVMLAVGNCHGGQTVSHVISSAANNPHRPNDWNEQSLEPIKGVQYHLR